MTCETCHTEIEPMALLMGSTPGMSCACGWQSLRRFEFKRIFGYPFTPQVNIQGPGFEGVQTDSFIYLHSKGYSGTSHQRRKQKRAALSQR